MRQLLYEKHTLEKLSLMYGTPVPDAVSVSTPIPAQIDRYVRLGQKHMATYPHAKTIHFFSAPGRTEIGGNHTDHQRGRVLAAAVNMDTIAAVSPRDDGEINLRSDGYANGVRLDLSDLSFKEGERESTTALVRGIAARFSQLGYKIGGFEASVTSDVLKGSGLSSSAAFEVMICAVFNGLYNENNVMATECAKISQYAENNFFGKPSGLMDQTASSVGGLVTIDFMDKDNPEVSALSYDFAEKGYSVVVVNTGGNHADLTDEYAAIPGEMRKVAELLSGEVLRDIDPAVFYSELPGLLGKVPDRALLRAIHFFGENERVKRQVEALSRDDLPLFLKEIRASGESSYHMLQNIYSSADDQRIALALALSENTLGADGAFRVHGGGFAGTILAFVPHDRLPAYESTMNNVFGKNSCARLQIRPVGAVQVI